MSVILQRYSAKQTAGSLFARRSLYFHIETYGCQMNVNDSEIVRSILLDQGHVAASKPELADLILTNTCAIR